MTPRSDQTPSISCVIPAFNEARNLGTVVPHILATLASLSDCIELIVVDDGSRDDTTRVMQTLCATHAQLVYLKLSRNFGKEPALTAGIDATRGEVVVLMDADGQHPAALLPEMCTLDCGSMNFSDGDYVAVVTPNQLRTMAQRVQVLGV